MSFLFNFPTSSDDHESPSTDESCSMTTTCQSVSDNNVYKKCKEVQQEEADLKLTNDVEAVLRYRLGDDLCMAYLDSDRVESQLRQQDPPDTGITPTTLPGLVQASQQHSDLIPDVYEGGLKLWECSIDLCDYLHRCDICFTNTTVLELGCGAGVPGILAMMKGAREVHFQDYNGEVLSHYTIPNVHLNRTDQMSCTCRYFSGDWDNFTQHLSRDNIKYDIILTAETIYRRENYQKLLIVFQQYLKDKGTIYLAAKSNYFGVGGGTRDFETFIQHQGDFHIEMCHSTQHGLPREVLKLTRKSTTK